MSEPKRPEINEIATAKKDVELFGGWLGRLENPDPILRGEPSGKGIKLYDEIARDAHAGGILEKRYRSVVGKEWEVLPVSEKRQDAKIAEFVKEALLSSNFDQAREKLLQAVLYGFSVCEIMWRLEDGDVKIDQFLDKRPHRFIFTPERELRLLTPTAMIDGDPVPPRKFIVFTYGSADNPYGEGLGRRLWWPIWFKKNGIKFWVMFAEKFGGPTGIGKYPPGTEETDQNKLLDAIRAIHQETGVIIPETMDISLLEAARTTSINTYETLCSFMNAEMSKTVLGGTLTTEIGRTGGAYSAAETQQEAELSIIKADADALCACLNRTVVRWLVDYNFGPQKVYPQIWIRTDPEEDLKGLAERDRILAKDIGLPVGKKYFYDTYGIPDPQGEEDLVRVPPAAAPGPFAEEENSRFQIPNSKKKGSDLKAAIEGQRRLDKEIDEAVEEAVPLFENCIEKISAFLSGIPSLEEGAQKIAGLYPEMDSGPLAEQMAEKILAADRIGATSAGGPSFAETLWGPGLPFRDAQDYFRAKALTIAGVSKADLLAEVKDEILKAMEEGTTLSEFQKTAREMFDRFGYTDVGRHRIETIYRTNMQSAYQAGRYRQLTDPAVLAARPYWRYVAVLDAATRPAHAAMHGKIFPADDPIWDTWYPPNGFNCRCTVQSLSASEMEREGWKVEKEDPTGKLYEPTDPETGKRMPARPLMPDPGWTGRGGDLAALLKKKEEEIQWKARPGQPGAPEAGRPREKEIPPRAYLPSPQNYPSREDYRIKGVPEDGALREIEGSYKKLMGISPAEKQGVLRDILDEAITVDVRGLAHMMKKTEGWRERYIGHLRPTIENPFEIWLTEYETAGGGTKFRKRYIGLYADASKKMNILVVGEIGPEMSLLWDAFQIREKTLDRLRAGKLIYGRP